MRLTEKRSLFRQDVEFSQSWNPVDLEVLKEVLIGSTIKYYQILRSTWVLDPFTYTFTPNRRLTPNRRFQISFK